ncbi:MAG: hypothetical protein QF749_13795 [Verrucomicrobiota bacterium]|nr:hypothetical protein [Phycisphaeraceae bacterium]MDP7179352.1 hypothetical protein [Verrucomicrobiota bacterium]
MVQPPTKPFTPRPGDVPDTGEGLIAPEDRELSGKLAGLSLPRQVVVLAIWPLLEQALNFLVTFIDTMITGHLPIERQSVPAMDAITVGGYVIWVVGMLQMWTCSQFSAPRVPLIRSCQYGQGWQATVVHADASGSRGRASGRAAA